jgi:hypothetical protein
MRRRPKKIAIRPVEAYRRPIADAHAMHSFLTESKQRGYRSIYFIEAWALDTPEVKKALATEQRCRIVKMKSPELLSAAYAWQQQVGGLKLFTTLYGQLEQLI